MPDSRSSGAVTNPYTPLPFEVIERDIRRAQPWKAALLTLFTSAVVAFVTAALVMIVSSGFQRAIANFGDEDFRRLSVICCWGLIPGLISAILASQLARGRSTAREVLLFWGLLGIPLLIAIVASATPVNELIVLIAVVGAPFIFQPAISIFFGRVFRGTEEFECEKARPNDNEGGI